ncbi:MAG TPA: hypothetical protein VNN80_20100 [Polyangiaceae bacterium]|nr:hypothetical protein [Polyangiaceae bacterium]
MRARPLDRLSSAFYLLAARCCLAARCLTARCCLAARPALAALRGPASPRRTGFRGLAGLRRAGRRCCAASLASAQITTAAAAPAPATAGGGLDPSAGVASPQPAAGADAEPPQPAAASAQTSAAPEPRAPAPLPQVAAVFPGFLVHGSGVWLQGRNQTAARLLLLEGAGILATLASGVILFQTGAARDVVGPTALLAVAGVGAFGTSFAANLYATWAPPDGLGQPLVRLPGLESSVGYLYVYDPQFPQRHFLTAQLSGRLGPWHLAAGASRSTSGGNDRLELAGGYRVLGPRGYGSAPAPDGSYLEPRLGVSQHAFDDDGFSSLVMEVALEGRLDVDRYLPDVRGAFFQGEAGYGRQVFRHDLPGANPSTDVSLLLAHVGFGMYLGNRRGDGSGGELELYYDHRHDGYAGGLKVNGLGSGPAGHFGLRGNYQLSPRWGLRARSEAGSAYTIGMDLVARWGLQ